MKDTQGTPAASSRLRSTALAATVGAACALALAPTALAQGESSTEVTSNPASTVAVTSPVPTVTAPTPKPKPSTNHLVATPPSNSQTTTAKTRAATTTTATTAPTTDLRPKATVTTTATDLPKDGHPLKGSTWHVKVSVSKWVPNTHVTVILSFDGEKRPPREFLLKEAANGTRGIAQFEVANMRATKVAVRASIAYEEPIQPAVAKTLFVIQKTPSVKAGEKSQAVRQLQGMLAAKKYVVGQKGVYDSRTQRAVMAFRKVTGMPRNYSADQSVFKALIAGKGTFKVRYPKHGRHIEGSIRKQVLALIGKGGKVAAIYPTSSGAPATPTIRGSFKVYRKDPGTNAKGMYKSSYFIRGYAIHGYPSVPPYNASHGCFRVPMEDAARIYAFATMGMTIDSYY